MPYDYCGCCKVDYMTGDGLRDSGPELCEDCRDRPCVACAECGAHGAAERCSECGEPGPEYDPTPYTVSAAPLYVVWVGPGKQVLLNGPSLTARLADDLDLDDVVEVLDKPDPGAIVDLCPCGRVCTVAEWDARPVIGVQPITGHPKGFALDYRDCPGAPGEPCGSTRTRIVSSTFATAIAIVKQHPKWKAAR